MSTFEHGEMKMIRLGNGSVTLIFPLGHLNINIYGKILLLHSIMVFFPRYHRKIWLKPIKEHLFLWEGGEIEESLPGFTTTAQPRCCKKPSRQELFSQQICKERRDGFIPVDREECESWKDKGEGVDPWLLAVVSFGDISLLCFPEH